MRLYGPVMKQQRLRRRILAISSLRMRVREFMHAGSSVLGFPRACTVLQHTVVRACKHMLGDCLQLYRSMILESRCHVECPVHVYALLQLVTRVIASASIIRLLGVDIVSHGFRWELG
jgi:hypothetical protein